MRKLAVAFALLAGLYTVKVIAVEVAMNIAWWTLVRPDYDRSWPRIAWFSVQLLAHFAMAGVFWLALIRWRRGLIAGRPNRLLQRSALYSLSLAILFLILRNLMPHVHTSIGSASIVSGATLSSIARQLDRYYSVLGIAGWAVALAAWLWWCDQPPRAMYSIACGLAAYIAWQLTWNSPALYVYPAVDVVEQRTLESIQAPELPPGQTFRVSQRPMPHDDYLFRGVYGKDYQWKWGVRISTPLRSLFFTDPNGFWRHFAASQLQIAMVACAAYFTFWGVEFAGTRLQRAWVGSKG
jgi:hypothetical protein